MLPKGNLSCTRSVFWVLHFQRIFYFCNMHFIKEILEKKIKVNRTGHKVRFAIRLFAAILASVFTYLKLSGVPAPDLNSEESAEIIFKVSLVILFAAWVYGPIFDSRLQEEVITHPPKRINIKDYGIMTFIMILFGTLCFFANSLESFGIVFFIFWITNVFAWFYLIKYRLKSSFEKSEQDYKNNTIWLFKLRLVEDFMCGRFQKTRFLTGIILISLYLILMYTDLFSYLSLHIESLNSDSLASLYILLFIISFECWIFYYRFKTKISLNLLDKIDSLSADISSKPTMK